MLRSLRLQQRCSRVSGNTLSGASRRPPAPLAIARRGGFIPRSRRQRKTRSRHSVLSLVASSIASRRFSPPVPVPIAICGHLLSMPPRTGM